MKPAIAFIRIATILTGWAILSSTAPAAEGLFWRDGYNVVWTTPSKHSGESMPVVGGDIGLNVWIEDGDVLFYVGQSGCVDEIGALLKHGRVRISLQPDPFVAGAEFRQELKLHGSFSHATLSDWGWHTAANPENYRPEETMIEVTAGGGRKTPYAAKSKHYWADLPPNWADLPPKEAKRS
jgi:hypothetical protein